MGLELLTELLGLPGCFVKDKVIKRKEIFLILERQGYPTCPRCKQVYLSAPKDSRFQEVEDLSVFGRRCYLRILKYRIECTCGYRGTEYLEWLDRYQRFTVRYRKWIYAFCKRMTGIDVSRIFGISKHTVYRLDREGIEEEIANAKKLGYVTTILGRRRYLPDINNKNQAIRQFAERQAVNTPIQGSASDLIKLAMVEIHGQIKNKLLKAKMIMQIHDELVFDVAISELKELQGLIRDRMENVLKLDVPIKVDIKKGTNWLEMKPMEER